ncbi:hypothetical protein MKW92_000143 [Papaver armeniacum]|nr:hypothetical protein MKW92_000143 [Papaver armeniacum]
MEPPIFLIASCIRNSWLVSSAVSTRPASTSCFVTTSRIKRFSFAGGIARMVGHLGFTSVFGYMFMQESDTSAFSGNNVSPCCTTEADNSRLSSSGAWTFEPQGSSHS